MCFHSGRLPFRLFHSLEAVGKGMMRQLNSCTAQHHSNGQGGLSRMRLSSFDFSRDASLHSVADSCITSLSLYIYNFNRATWSCDEQWRSQYLYFPCLNASTISKFAGMFPQFGLVPGTSNLQDEKPLECVLGLKQPLVTICRTGGTLNSWKHAFAGPNSGMFRQPVASNGSNFRTFSSSPGQAECLSLDESDGKEGYKSQWRWAWHGLCGGSVVVSLDWFPMDSELGVAGVIFYHFLSQLYSETSVFQQVFYNIDL